MAAARQTSRRGLNSAWERAAPAPRDPDRPSADPGACPADQPPVIAETGAQR